MGPTLRCSTRSSRGLEHSEGSADLPLRALEDQVRHIQQVHGWEHRGLSDIVVTTMTTPVLMSAGVTRVQADEWREVWLQAQLAIEDRQRTVPAGEPSRGLASFVSELAERMTSQLAGGASSSDQRIPAGLDETDRAYMRESTEAEFERLANSGAISIEHPGPRPWDEVITQNMGDWFGQQTRNRRSNQGNGQTHLSGNRQRQRAIVDAPRSLASEATPPDHSGGPGTGDPRDSSEEDRRYYATLAPGEWLGPPSTPGDSERRSLEREHIRLRHENVLRRRAERDRLNETQRRSRIDTPPQNERTAVPLPRVPPLPVPMPIVHQYRGFRDATSAPMLRPGMVPNPEQLVAILRTGQRFHALDCTLTNRGAEYVSLRLALGRRFTSCMTCHGWRYILYDQVPEASVRQLPTMPVHGAWVVPNPQSPQRRRGRNHQRNSPTGPNNTN